MPRTMVHDSINRKSVSYIENIKMLETYFPKLIKNIKIRM